MNTVVCIFALCFAVTLGASVDKYESRTKVDEACLIEYGIDPAILNDENIIFTDEQIYCVGACIYRDYGVMKPDGTIDEIKVETFFTEEDEEERNLFFAVYNACKIGNVACKLVQCMFGELKNHIGHAGLDSLELSKRLLSGKSIVEYA